MSEDKFFEKPKEGKAWDVAIIGSGPSAFTAAIYTTRGAASTLLLAGNTWGGQLMLTTEVDNFPGFPDGIQGPELMGRMRKQVERFHAEIVDKNVEEVLVDSKPFVLRTDSDEYRANSIIIATGAETKWLQVPGEEKLRGRGVSSCAPCDAPFFKNREVIVVGGGDSAMEEALVLTKYAKKVYVVHRRGEFKASAAMQKKVLENEMIEVIWHTEVVEMIGDQKLEKVKLRTKEKIDQHEAGEWEMPIEGVFVAIGHIPSTSIIKGKIELDSKGYVQKTSKEGYSMATSVDGVFVAGDVHDTHYRQAITAAGFGCKAGMEVLKYLDKDAPSY